LRLLRLAAVCLALFSFGAAADLIKENTERLERFRVIQQATNEYVKGLALEGKPARTARETAEAIGFRCTLKNVYMSARDTEPMFQCIKAPTEVQGCLEMLLSLSVNWQDPKRPLVELIREELDQPVRYAAATCKVP
jgi:hypothetical protein